MKVAIVFALTIVAVLGKEIPRLGFPSFEYSEVTGRVVGGKEATRNSAKYIVSMQRQGSHFCGGSIIRSDVILTAAHCMVYPSFDLVAGLHTLGTGTSQKRASKTIIKHKSYGGGVGPYDIALVVVDRPFTYDSTVQPINLPAKGAIHSGQVTLFGWGSVSTTNTASMPKNLQTIDKPIVEYSACERALGGAGASPLRSSNLCTGPLTGGVSACSGDSGGPLVQNNQIVGVVSWGYIPCGSVNRPSVYTRTSEFIDWINTNMP